VGSDQDVEALVKQTETKVQKHREKAAAEMDEAFKAAVESIQAQIKEVLQGDLAQALKARLEINQKVSAQNVGSIMDVKRLRSQVYQIQSFGEEVGKSITKWATKPGTNTAGRVFLRSTDSAGSFLHQRIYEVGKLLGLKFKPYGAVNIAKGVGNVAKFLGPIVAVGALAADIHEMNQENQRDKELAEARFDITSQFQAMAKDLESQVDGQLREFEAQVYGEIEKQIASARHDEEKAIATSNKWIGQLAESRKEFEGIIHSL
jgi:hypothetical protein